MSNSDSSEMQFNPNESLESRQIRNVQKPGIKTATSLLFSALKKSKKANKNEILKQSSSSQDIINIDGTSSSSCSPSILTVTQDGTSATTSTTIESTSSTESTTSLASEKHKTNATYSDAMSSNEDNSNNSKSACVQQENLTKSTTESQVKNNAKSKVNKSKKTAKLINSYQYSSISSYESCQQTPNYLSELQNELSYASSDDAFYSSVKKVDSNNNLLETTIQSEENLRKSSTSTVQSVYKSTDEKLNAKPIVLVEKLSDVEYKAALEREEKRKKTTRVRTKKNLGDDFYTYGLLSSDESLNSIQSTRTKMPKNISSSTANSTASSIEKSNNSNTAKRGRSKSTKRHLVNDFSMESSEIKMSAKMKKYASTIPSFESEMASERKMSENDSVYTIRMQQNGKMKISKSNVNSEKSDKQESFDAVVSLNEESNSSSSSVRILKNDENHAQPNELIVVSSASTSTLANIDTDANKNDSCNSSNSNQFAGTMVTIDQIEEETQQQLSESKEQSKEYIQTSVRKSRLLFASSDQKSAEVPKLDVTIDQGPIEMAKSLVNIEKPQKSEPKKVALKKKGKKMKKIPLKVAKKNEETKIPKVADKSKVVKSKASSETKAQKNAEQKKLVAAVVTSLASEETNKDKQVEEEQEEESAASEKRMKKSSINTYKIPRLKLADPGTCDQETTRTAIEKEKEKEKKNSMKPQQVTPTKKTNELVNKVTSPINKKSTLTNNQQQQQQQESTLNPEQVKATKTKEPVEKKKKAVRKQTGGQFKVKTNSLLMNTFNFITRNSLKNSAAVGQNVSNLQLDVFSSSNMTHSVERSTRNANLRLRRPVDEVNSRQELLTLSQIMEKKNKFNESLGVSYPYFSFLFLFDEYVKKMSTIQSLDFNLLLENVQREDQDVSAELSVNRLDHKEKVELCKLMSRSAGKFNIYKAVGFGNDLRNPSLNLNQNVHIRVDFGSESDEIEYVLSLISSLTLAKAYAAYSYFKSRLNSPFRVIQVYWDEVRNYDAVRVTFENDMLIESEDASLEQCVNFVLHKRSTQGIEIRRSLHSFYAQKLNSSSSIFDMNECTEEDQAYFLEEAKSRINDEPLWDSMFINNFIANLKKIPLMSLEELRRVKNYTLKNYLKRKTNPDFEKFEHPDDKPRFVGKARSSVSWRGHMQKAIKHKLLNENELQYRLSKLLNQPDFNLDINNLFQKT